MTGEGFEMWKLPENWRWIALAEVCRIFAGSSAPQGDKYYRNGIYPFVRTRDVGAHGRTTSLTSTSDYLNDLAIENCPLTLAQKGTILFPKSGASILTNNRALLGMNAYVVSHLAAVEAQVDKCLPRYAYYWLCTVEMQDYIHNLSYPSLELSAIAEIPMPLPPLDEQRRIVTRIEALFDRIEEARRLRVAAREDAEGILEAALEQALDEVYAKSPDILQLAAFASVFNGRASGSGESGVRVFKTRHVYPFDLRQTDPSYMKSEQVAKCPLDRFLSSDDVLVCNIARGTLGRVCHVDKVEENWTVDTQIMILRARERCLGRWLFYYLYSRRGQAEILAREKGIAFADKRGQTHLYPREMQTVSVPLPPLPEQHRIVEYLDGVQAQVAELKRLQTGSAAELERLGGAVLARAFQGEL